MTIGTRRSTDPKHPARVGSAVVMALLLAATAPLAGCGGGGGSSDTTAPTVVITDSVSAVTAAGDVTFFFTFSEDVGTSFTAGSVAVTGGTKGTFTRVNATYYSLVVTPTAGASGTITVTLAAASFADLAGNGSTAAVTATQPFDTRPPVLTQMTLPVNFDSATVAYGLVGFEGAEDSTIVADPVVAANKVAKVVKSATAQPWAGTTITAVTGGVQTGFSEKVPFAADATRMTVRVYSPTAGIPVRLKVEDHADAGVSVETEATTTLVNTWETLTFDFAHQATGTAALDLAKSYDKATLFFNFGVAGATAGEKTYYFDDLIFIGGGGIGGGTTPFATITFDAAGATYTLTGFGGAEDSSVQVDPDPAAPTNHAVRVNRSATAETWAGTTISTGANNSAGKLPFDAANTRMTVRVYSPDAGITVRLKVENAADQAIKCETDATTTATNAWETLTFDFASPAAGTAALNFAATYDKVSIFFNFGVTGATAGAKTYWADDVTFIGGTGGGGTTPFATITFDDAGVTYTLTDFEGAIGGAVVADPAGGGNMVGKTVKPATAQLWAGTTVSTGLGQSAGKLPFDATHTRMTVRVYSPDAGIKVRLKVENAADRTITCETEATTTVADTWETLTFDFANHAAGTAALNLASTYDKVSIFFNFMAATVGADKTYYFDDLAFVP